MPTRALYIERILIQVYGQKPTDDAEITANLVNAYLNDGFAIAAKQNYVESIKMDGVAYLNNSFYTTFKNIDIAADNSEEFLFSLTLPQVPVGLGTNEGISAVRLTKDGGVSIPVVVLSENEWSRRNGMRKIPNKIVGCPEGNLIKLDSTLQLWSYKANVTMISPGLNIDLNSVISIPEEYMPVIQEYVTKMLMIEKAQVKDQINDSVDN